jgi:transcriptional regulator of acetoin/glycerol metabolism
MERAAALTEGSRVDLEDLPADVRLAHPAPTPAVEGVRPLADVVKEYIIASLAFNDGNQTQTAKQLQIGSATLYRKLKQYGLVQARTRPMKS